MTLHLLEDGINNLKKIKKMISNPEDLKKVIASMKDGNKGVTNQQRQDYNDFVGHLKKRGVAGEDKLDKNNLGKNMLSQYIKDNPKTTITHESILPLQHDLANQRQWSIQNYGVPKRELTKDELDEFSNYSGKGGKVAVVKDLNKKLDEYGLKGAGLLYQPIQDDLTKGDNVSNIHQDWIATAASRAIAKAKSLGIPPTPEAFEVNKKVIFGNDKYADTILNNKEFQRMYPNYISVVSHIYKDRNDNFDKQQQEAHMSNHKVIDGQVGSRMTSLNFSPEYMKSQENAPEEKTKQAAESTVENIPDSNQ